MIPDSFLTQITEEVIRQLKSRGVNITPTEQDSVPGYTVISAPDVQMGKILENPHFITDSECTSCGICAYKCSDKAIGIIQAGANRLSGKLGMGEVRRDLASMIDHTLLKADATKEQISQLCAEARKYGFMSVCINPTYVSYAHELLIGSPVKVCTVVGFPLGANIPAVKAFETAQAIRDGAEEIDMVINIGALKSGDYQLVEDDIRGVVSITKKYGFISKVIIETALLTTEEKIKACVLAKAAGADFVKTSTGFSSSGATVEDVALMKSVVGRDVGVKASGGIKDQSIARAMIQAGASRIGASASVKIVEGGQGTGNY